MNSQESRCLIAGPPSGDHLRLKVVEITPEGQEGGGDFSLSVSVTCNGFTATDCGCWIASYDFADFLIALRSFEASRVGRATLESMSPGIFIYTITSSSPTRWPVITGTVTGPYLGCGRGFRSQLNFAFTLDSSFVVQLLRDFERLVPNSRDA